LKSYIKICKRNVYTYVPFLITTNPIAANIIAISNGSAPIIPIPLNNKAMIAVMKEDTANAFGGSAVNIKV